MTQDQKKQAFFKLNEDFINALNETDISFPKNVVAILNENSVTIGLKKEDGKYFKFASEVYIYKRVIDWEDLKRGFDYSINFGSSSSFTPNDKSPYTRTLIAAELLQNWHTMKKIVAKYTKEYVVLRSIEHRNLGV